MCIRDSLVAVDAAGIGDDLAAGDSGHLTGGGLLGQTTAELFLLAADIPGGDQAPHGAAAPQNLGEMTGVDAVDAGDPLLLQQLVQGLLTAEIGGLVAPFPHNVTLGPDPGGLEILHHNAVVPYGREGLDDELAKVTGVGEGFHVTYHVGCKNSFSLGIRVRAEGPSLKLGAVRQQKNRLFRMFCHFHTSNSLVVAGQKPFHP